MAAQGGGCGVRQTEGRHESLIPHTIVLAPKATDQLDELFTYIAALTCAFSIGSCRSFQVDDFGREMITTREAEAANDRLSGLTTKPMSQRKDARRSGHPESTGPRQVFPAQEC